MSPDPDVDTAEAVKVRGLSRSFGAVQAVDHVDLDIKRGEIYGFLGQNGAGKSTLVRMLCTLLQPTGGQAWVAGFDVVRQPRAVRLRIGVTLQEAALDDRQTGRDLLRFHARLYGMRGRQIDRRLADVLDLVDIGTAIDRNVGTYSGGMKRRLDLAISLIHRPDILFLDEPTTGLDPASRASVWQEVARLNRELQTTIFLTTQYLEEADTLAHRVGIIAEGRLVAQGTPGELKRGLSADVVVAEVHGDDPACVSSLAQLPGVRTVTRENDRLLIHTDDGPTILSQIAVTLASSRFQIHNLTLRTPTLDDVFFEITGTTPAPHGHADDSRQSALSIA